MTQLGETTFYELHKGMQKENMDFLYKGQLNTAVVDALLGILKRKVQDLGVEYILAKRIYNIAVECLENMCQHGDTEVEVDSIFLIGNEKGTFYVATGNLVSDDTVGKLTGLLGKINDVDREGLKELYRDRLSDTSEGLSNNAGMGLIDIALKANGKIEYRFNDHPKGKQFFSMQVIINMAG